MAFHPKVSIVIPVYNGSNYLKEAIDSALNQSYKNIEVIVINDGSNDEGKTESIAKSYKNKIRYFKKSNGGVSTALNLGIKKMTGKYFSWLSHDDLYTRDKVKLQINFLSTQKNKNIILYSDFDQIDFTGKMFSSVKVGGIKPAQFVEKMILSHPIQGCTGLIPKAVFGDVGLFNPKLKTTQDYDMWFRMAQKYDFVHQGELLVKSRVHKGQGTNYMKSVFIDEGNDLFIGWLKKIKVRNTNKYFDFSVSLIKKCYLAAGTSYFAVYSKSSVKNYIYFKNYFKYIYLKLLFTIIIIAQHLKYKFAR